MRTTRLAPRAVRRAALLLAATALLAGGCGGDKGTGPGSNPAGTYVLHDIDAQALPVTIHQGPWLDPGSVTFYNKYILQITGGVIELGSDDRFTLTLDGAVNADGVQFAPSTMVTGDYEIDGGEVWFMPDGYGGNGWSASIGNGTVSFDMDLMSKGASLEYSFRR